MNNMHSVKACKNFNNLLKMRKVMGSRSHKITFSMLNYLRRYNELSEKNISNEQNEEKAQLEQTNLS